MPAFIRRHFGRISYALWFAGAAGCGYLILQLPDQQYAGSGFWIAVVLLATNLVWALYWDRRWLGYYRKRNMLCKKCGGQAPIHVIDVGANPDGPGRAVTTSHWCRRHQPKIKMPEGLKHLA
jgi:hypothetical protein